MKEKGEDFRVRRGAGRREEALEERKEGALGGELVVWMIEEREVSYPSVEDCFFLVVFSVGRKVRPEDLLR